MAREICRKIRRVSTLLEILVYRRLAELKNGDSGDEVSTLLEILVEWGRRAFGVGGR